MLNYEMFVLVFDNSPQFPSDKCVSYLFHVEDKLI